MIKLQPDVKLSSLCKSLELNVKIQAVLKDEMTKVKNLLVINKEKQAFLEKVIDDEQCQISSQKGTESLRVTTVFAAPYFRDAKEMIPPPNEDAIIKRKNQEVNPLLTPPKPWCSSEQKKLLDGVTAYALLSALKPLRRERDHIKRKMKNENITEKEMEDLEDYLYITEQKIRLAKRKSLQELMEQLDDKIDWMTISAAHLEGVRTPNECEIMWKNYLSFFVNKEAFTQVEDNRLADLAEDHNERNWDIIAACLKTNRTAIQCFARYKTKLKSNLKKKYWTREDDDRLIALIEEHKSGNIIPWSKISLLMEGYTATQIRDRYRRSILTRFSRGPFSPEEDALLIALYQKYGHCWRKMTDYFKRKSIEAIRERYLNVLVPNLKVGPWSLQEDKLFIAMIKEHGYGQWTKISKTLSGRTDQACLCRAKRLLKWSIDYHSEKGTEYDPDVYDPLLFANILRPLPQSEYRNATQNKKLRPERENGLKTLAKALEIVAPEYVAGIQDLNSIDVSCMSSEMLHKLSDSLHASLPEREKSTEAKPIIPYINKPLPLRKRVELESDDDDYMLLPEETVSQEEQDLIQSALLKLLEMQADVIQPVLRKTLNFTTKQWAEMSLYTAYLIKEFNCKTDNNQEKVVFDEVDYGESLQNVTRYFIQPPVYDNQFIILMPNLSTMTGMETIQATENRLLNMSECASHSKSYIDYLCERRRSSPQCLQCLHKSGKISSNATPESIMSDMKKRSFLLDKRLETAAYIEGASAEKLSNTCVCRALGDSIKSVQLLRKRFLSLFMWPSLISDVKFSDEQEHIICTERVKNYNYFLNMCTIPKKNQGLKKNRQKRKRTTDLDEQATKKLKLEEFDLLGELLSEESESKLLEELLTEESESKLFQELLSDDDLLV